MKPSNLINFLVFAIDHNLPVLLKGKPGVGKTDCVKQAVSFLDARDRAKKGGKASERGVDLVISHPVVSDPTDFKGLPMPSKDGETANFLPFGDLQKLIKAVKKTVFFLDDLGQASSAVQASAMQLILGRQINGHKVSDNVVFLSATNRKEDKAGVVGILEPVKSRFASIVQLDVDVNDWCSWAFDNDMPIELIAFNRFRPNFIDSAKPTNDIVNTPCPRTIANVGYLMKSGLPKELEYEAFSGAVGEAYAIEFCAFLKLFREMPDLDQILLNPDKVDVPSKPDLQYAICGGLSYRANEVNFGNVVKYLKRFPQEFQAFAVKDITALKPDLAKTGTFIKWATDVNNKVL